MLVTCEEMKRREAEAFARGVSAEDLMEQAGRGLAEIVRQFHPHPGRCLVVAGKGHNAGDAFVAARYLAPYGWQIDLRLMFAPDDLAPLAAKMLATVPPTEPVSSCAPRVVLDGLLGIGAQGEPRGPVAEGIKLINQERRTGAWVLAIDLPSGLDGDTGEASSCCVVADLTATIAAPKTGLLADRAAGWVGRLALVPLDGLSDEPVAAGSTGPRVAWARDLRSWLPPRNFDLHKGLCGRIGLVAGSPGFVGAARMCSGAAVRAGGGLVTVFAQDEIARQLAVSCPPEVMVKTVRTYREVLDVPLDVVAIGPGLGLDSANDVLTLIQQAPQPMVVDADALNVVARDPTVLHNCRGPRLLTPHPGEMERLFAQNGRDRLSWLNDFLSEYPLTLLLKGSRTVTGNGEGERYFNSTGNPGMASGGMGDVLTGTCAALLAQMKSHSPLQSAVLAAWICGRAAEIALVDSDSPESLSASRVIDHLGAAFTDLRNGVW